MKYIDVDKLIAEIERMREINRKAFEADHIESDVFHGRTQAINHLFEFITSLQQEQPKQKKKCDDCPHCVDRKDQYGWHFKGCFGGPYKGKFIAEIEECPLQQEQPEVELEKEISKWLEEGEITDTRFDDYDDSDIERTARHFYELARQKYEK